MRILVYGMGSNISGGIESFLLNMNRHMSSDCVFDYVVVGNECIHSRRIEANGGRVYLISPYRKNPVRFLTDSWKVAREGKEDHDVAYFNLFSMCHILGVLLCKIMGYRIVLHAHNSNCPGKSKLYYGLHCFDRWLLSGMRCTRLTNSEPSGVFMFGKKAGRENRTILIYNAIDVPQFLFYPEVRERKREELGIGEKVVIGFAGRLSQEKNLKFLMEIFSKIQEKERNAVLLIAGDGGLKAEVEQTAVSLGVQESVKLLGNRSDLNELYQAMDAFILPSLFEGLGIVLIEAQAAGLRCFTSAGVVPPMVQISEQSLHYISLSEPAEQWAMQVLQEIKLPFERTRWNHVVAAGKFNIEKEALRLQKILTN